MEWSNYKVAILGSGTSAGVPVIGCHCAVCKSANPRDKRTRASVAVKQPDGKAIVIDTSPEFRLQAIASGIDQVEHILYTHTHADHCHGFDDVRAFYFHRKSPVNIYLALEHQEEFKQRFSYAFENTGYIGVKPMVEIKTITEQMEVGGLVVESMPLEHGNVRSYAFRFGSFAYATDFKAFTSEQVGRWRNKVTTMVASGIHFRSHATHSVIQETVALFEALGVKKGYITHLSHEVDAGRDRAQLPENVEFCYDGMEITLE